MNQGASPTNKQPAHTTASTDYPEPARWNSHRAQWPKGVHPEATTQP